MYKFNKINDMKIFAVTILLAVIAGCFGRTSPIKTGKEGHPMPSFNMLLMDSLTQLNMKNIPNDKPIVLFLFSPYCPYCRAQTNEIIDDIRSLQSIRFYMISPYPFSPIKSYYNEYHLNKYENITVGQDKDILIGNYFGANVAPYFAIYGKDKRLRRVLLGKTSINTIKDIALE
jgi:hypothetical protein